MALLTGGFGVVQSIVAFGLGGRILHTHAHRSNTPVVDPDVGFRGPLAPAGETDYPVWAPLHPEMYNARGVVIHIPEEVAASRIAKFVAWLSIIRPATCNYTVVDADGVVVATLTSPAR